MKKLSVSSILVTFFAVFIVVGMVWAIWTPPTVAPPGANVDIPLNVGPFGQEKIGGLIVNTGGTATSIGFIVDQGNVGIGTTNPGEQLTIRGNDNNIQLEQSSVTDNLKLRFANPTGGFLGNVMYEDSEDSLIIGRNGDPGITFWPNYDVTIAEDAAPPNEGRVGIGTDTPVGKLHVVGRADIDDVVVFVKGAETGAAGSPGIKVGIGTESPQSKLQINGGYLQLDLTVGAPPGIDCDAAAERGRMIIDSAAGLLYICVDSGWIIK